MGIIKLEKIKLYAFHGCLIEEEKIGADYEVDIRIETDFSLAAESDKLSATVDYVEVYNLVKKEMGIRSKLLEHVCKRIVQQLKLQFNQIKAVSVTVSKLNPPMNGNIERVSIRIDE